MMAKFMACPAKPNNIKPELFCISTVMMGFGTTLLEAFGASFGAGNFPNFNSITESIPGQNLQSIFCIFGATIETVFSDLNFIPFTIAFFVTKYCIGMKASPFGIVLIAGVLVFKVIRFPFGKNLPLVPEIPRLLGWSLRHA